MARITLSDVGHTYTGEDREETFALKPLDATWQDGHTYALVGPSGCGKTTMLNIISGLVRPFRGRVLFDELDVTDVPTAKRNIAQVFQFPVIYSSMTVFENLAFPLVCRGWSKTTIKAKVMEIAELLDLGDQARRPAHTLTADQKQLISLGRGLVREDVSALLMDEPLTVIDPQFKFHLRRKLKEINQRFRHTVIYVTHDQNEAMTFAAEVAVMSDGRMVQRGTPEELFENPATTYVGYFIGSPAMNFFAATPEDGRLRLGGSELRSGHDLTALPGDRLQIGIRPEYLEFASDPGENTVPARVTGVQDHGSVRVADILVAGAPAKLKLSRGRPIPTGETLVRFPVEKIRLYVDGVLVGNGGGPGR